MSSASTVRASKPYPLPGLIAFGTVGVPLAGLLLIFGLWTPRFYVTRGLPLVVVGTVVGGTSGTTGAVAGTAGALAGPVVGAAAGPAGLVVGGNISDRSKLGRVMGLPMLNGLLILSSTCSRRAA